jgi:DNA-binding NtrC family response regulator
MSPCAILCVDDEAVILLSLKQELRRAFGSRFMYETALDATQALEMIASLTAEGVSIILVISDWLMPGIKGDEFLAIVKERYSGIRSIMITGQASAEVIESVLGSQRAYAVLSKPWNPEELIRVVDVCCQAEDGA